MFDLRRLRLLIARYVKSKRIKLIILVLAGFFLAALILECLLNFRVRASLRESLGWGADSQVKISAKISWLSLLDLANGRVNWVQVEGSNCLLSDLRFARFHLANEGFIFNLPILLKERRLKLIRIQKTRIETIVTAAAFSNYLNLLYPQFKPEVRILPGELLLTGQARIFGKAVMAELAGGLKVAAPKNIRFYPTRLLISGRSVPKDFLQFASNQIPLEFSLMEDWPLAITEVGLEKGFVSMTFKEINSLKR